MKKLMFAVVSVLMAASSTLAQGIIVKYDSKGNTVWEKFRKTGGDGYGYSSITAVPDGMVAVGHSYVGGDGDAPIVKYDNNGNVVWEKLYSHYKGSNDVFYSTSYASVTTVSDGVVAVGRGMLDDESGFYFIAIIVKYDNNGNIVWEKKVGKSKNNIGYNSVTTVSDGVIAIGYNSDAIIVKYDNSGNVVWEKKIEKSRNSVNDYFSVTTVSDGVMVVGLSGNESNNKYYGSAIIAKYDNNGNIVWEKKLGENTKSNIYSSVTAVSDGVVAIRLSNGSGSRYYGNAIIEKYDNNGNLVWEKNLGKSKTSEFLNTSSVTAVSDGIVAVGQPHPNGDIIMVKYDNKGNFVWEKKKTSEKHISNNYPALTAIPDGFVVAGYRQDARFAP